MKDGELIQLELPPTTQYQLPNVKDSNNKPVMAIPFKTNPATCPLPYDIHSTSQL